MHGENGYVPLQAPRMRYRSTSDSGARFEMGTLNAAIREGGSSSGASSSGASSSRASIPSLASLASQTMKTSSAFEYFANIVPPDWFDAIVKQPEIFHSLKPVMDKSFDDAWECLSELMESQLMDFWLDFQMKNWIRTESLYFKHGQALFGTNAEKAAFNRREEILLAFVAHVESILKKKPSNVKEWMTEQINHFLKNSFSPPKMLFLLDLLFLQFRTQTLFNSREGGLKIANYDPDTHVDVDVPHYMRLRQHIAVQHMYYEEDQKFPLPRNWRSEMEGVLQRLRGDFTRLTLDDKEMERIRNSRRTR